MYAVGSGTLPEFLAWVYEKKSVITLVSREYRTQAKFRNTNSERRYSTIFIRQYLSPIGAAVEKGITLKQNQFEELNLRGNDVSGLVETNDARGDRANNGDRKVTWSF